MKVKKIFAIILICWIFISVDQVRAIKQGENQVNLPKGTKIEQRQNITRFLMQDGNIELNNTKAGLILKAYDKQGKLIYTGKQVKIYSGKTNREIPLESIRTKIEIDDDIAWNIKFKP